MKYTKRILWIFTLGVLVLAVAVSSAWFTLQQKKYADVSPVEIDKPPIISVLNNETTTLDILNLDGLQVGKQKCIVFCVTPSAADLITRYTLQLAYTTNLGESIDLYTCEYVGTKKPSTGRNTDRMDEYNGTPAVGDYVGVQSKDPDAIDTFYYYTLTATTADISTAMLIPDSTSTGDGYTGTETSVTTENRAVYKRYRDVPTSQDFRFQTGASWTSDWNNNRGRYVFYMLFVHWNAVPPNLTAKETDVVYISAKGLLDIT